MAHANVLLNYYHTSKNSLTYLILHLSRNLIKILFVFKPIIDNPLNRKKPIDQLCANGRNPVAKMNLQFPRTTREGVKYPSGKNATCLPKSLWFRNAFFDLIPSANPVCNSRSVATTFERWTCFVNGATSGE